MLDRGLKFDSIIIDDCVLPPDFYTSDYYMNLKKLFSKDDNERTIMNIFDAPKSIRMNPYTYFNDTKTRKKDIREYELFLKIEKRRAANKVARSTRSFNRKKSKGK
jgi:hypothetical protein